MLTPWEKYPEIPNGSIGWRMGRGEDYALEFFKWFKKLDTQKQNEFTAHNPEPEDWEGYYDAIKAETWEG